MDKRNVIFVTVVDFNKAVLKFNDLILKGFIGVNGSSENKVEGDKKTPIGEFEIGVILGMHNRDELYISNTIEYVKITNSMYWVCDVNSKYYNQLIDVSSKNKDWKEAEHLIEYKEEYEYAIEIKSNPNNVPNKGSAIFLHCGTGNTSRMYCS